MPIYRAEVLLHLVFPSTADLADPETGVALSAFFRAANADAGFGIALRAEPDPDSLGGYKLMHQLYFNAFGDPDTWSLISGTNTFEDLTAVFVFPQVIPLSIQVDTDADTVTWVTTEMRETRALSSFSADTGRLRPACVGGGVVLFSSNEPGGGSVEFRDFYGMEDGRKFLGAAMSSGDPGVWFAVDEYTTGPDPAVVHTETQNATTWEVEFSHAPPFIGVAKAPTRVMRCWNGGDNLNEGARTWVDATVCPISGQLYIAHIPFADVSKLHFYWSDDDAATLNQVVVEGGFGHSFQSPSIVVNPQGWVQIFVLDGAGQQLHFYTSKTFGKTWDTGQAYTVTNPPIHGARVRMDPLSGWFWLMYHGVNTTDLRLERFYPPDTSIDPAPIIVDTGFVETDRDTPDLFFTEAMRVRSFYTNNIIVLGESKDLGVNWLVVDTFSNRLRFSSVRHDDLTYHLYQNVGVGNTIDVYRSEDAGATADGSEVVATNILEQHAALAVGHRGQLYAVYQEGAAAPPTLAVRISRDRGQNWEVP